MYFIIKKKIPNSSAFTELHLDDSTVQSTKSQHLHFRAHVT